MDEHTQDAIVEEEAARIPVSRSSTLVLLPLIIFPKVNIAVYVSLIANVALCVLQST